MSKMLSSWKEIAQFFGKGVRTVQRWEKTLALPIHRPPGAPSNVVLARTSDLEAWMHQGPAERAIAAAPSVAEESPELMQVVGTLEREIRELQTCLGMAAASPEVVDAAPAEIAVAERLGQAVETLRGLRVVDTITAGSPEKFVQRLSWPAVLLDSHQRPIEANGLLSSLLKADAGTKESLGSWIDDETAKAASQALRKHMPTSLWHKQVGVDGRRDAFDLHLMPLTLDGGEVGLLVLLAPVDARHQASLAA